jgi:TRAP-type C4-dicarboxylate transport system substrate-binding protein
MLCGPLPALDFVGKKLREIVVKLRTFLFACMVMTSTVCSSFAQDRPVELKLSHWLPQAHPFHQSIQDWAASVKSASNGTITSTIFAAEQLGKAFDHYDMARDGISDFSYINAGY